MIPGIVLSQDSAKWGCLINGEYFAEEFQPKEGYSYEEVTSGRGTERFLRQLGKVIGDRLGGVSGYVLTVERLTMRKRIDLTRAAEKAGIKLFGIMDEAAASAFGISVSYGVEEGSYMQFWIHDEYGFFDAFELYEDVCEMSDKRCWPLVLSGINEPDIGKLREKLKNIVSGLEQIREFDHIYLGRMPKAVRNMVADLFPAEKVVDNWDEDVSILVGTLTQAGKMAGLKEVKDPLLLNCSGISVSLGNEEILSMGDTLPGERKTEISCEEIDNDNRLMLTFRESDPTEPLLEIPISLEDIWKGDRSETISVIVTTNVDNTFTLNMRNMERRETEFYDWKDILSLLRKEDAARLDKKTAAMEPHAAKAQAEITKEDVAEAGEDTAFESSGEVSTESEGVADEEKAESGEASGTEKEEPEESEKAAGGSEMSGAADADTADGNTEAAERPDAAEEAEESGEDKMEETAGEETVESGETAGTEAEKSREDTMEETAGEETEESGEASGTETEEAAEVEEEEEVPNVFETEQELEFDPSLFSHPEPKPVTGVKPVSGSEHVTEVRPAPEPKKESGPYARIIEERSAAQRRRNQNDPAAQEKRDTLKKILPILDCVDFGLMNTTGPMKAEDAREGLTATRRKMLDVLAELGVTPIPADNVPFDVNVHEAVGHIESGVYPENWVVKEVQTGFMMDGRVLRYSKVVVAN